MSLTVLITNIEMWPRTGTVLYVRDLALELQRQGHSPMVYTLKVGSVGEELRAAGIPVVTRLDRLAARPDVIHGHHLHTRMMAVQQLPGVPAVAVCHAHDSWLDQALLHPRVRRYFGVSRLCVARWRREGVPDDRLCLLKNFVDTRRFRARSPLPARPRRALVFSNHARPGTHLPAVEEACRRAALELDIVGEGMGSAVAKPEELLGRYDLVFAKAKAALEAMAVGAAVVLCDFGGVGPMVQSADLEDLSDQNFGFEALRGPLSVEPLLREISRYDPQDAALVRDRIRAGADLEGAVRKLVAIYRAVLEEGLVGDDQEETTARSDAARVGLYSTLSRTWMALGPEPRSLLKKLPFAAQALSWLTRRLLASRDRSPELRRARRQ